MREQPAIRRAFEGLREGRPIRDLEAVHIGSDGRRVIVSISAVPLRHPGGRFAGAIGMNADLTALKSRERRLSEALRVERTVLDSAGQAIAVVKQGIVQRCNDAFLRLAGLPPDELARTQLVACLLEPTTGPRLTDAADEARGRDQAVVRELRVRRGARLAHAEGAAWCQVTARSIAAGEFVLVIADIDTIKRREANALHEAQHDELTGLPNRRLLAERAAAALATSELRKVSCAVLAIDLDGFKEINDRYGHEVGDAVLREIAVRLTRVMRPQDTVARRGGDEFAVLVPDVGACRKSSESRLACCRRWRSRCPDRVGRIRHESRPASVWRWRPSRDAISSDCCNWRTSRCTTPSSRARTASPLRRPRACRPM